jgi:predicted phosphodiesterase
MIPKLNEIVIVGDVHGKWPMLHNICDKHKDKIVLGLGDIGLGFEGKRDPVFRENFRFFRGNHDNPAVCKAHPQYAVDYGMWGDVFIVAGADSIDKKWRKYGRDWWYDEQLHVEDRDAALAAWKEAKPDILICHEAPFKVHQIQKAASVTYDRNNEGWGPANGNDTAFLLDSMIQAHMPKMVVHGHWHNPLIYKQWGCVFVSLGELETLDLAEATKFFRVY